MRRATAGLLLGLVLASTIAPARVAAATASAALDVSWTRVGSAEVFSPPDAIRVGDTLTIAPAVEGLTSYTCISGLFRAGFEGQDAFQVTATSKDADDDSRCLHALDHHHRADHTRARDPEPQRERPRAAGR